MFDDLQAQLFANRAKFYYDLPAGPFYGFNRPGVKTIEPIVWNWWRQGMMGRRQGALRRHRRLLADRLHGGSEEDLGAGSGHA